MSKIMLKTVLVLCSIATGYRRAGFALEKGENELEVLPEQLKILQADPRLTVQESEATKPGARKTENSKLDSNSMGNGLDSNGLDSVELDLSEAPEKLAPFIAAIHERHKQAPLTSKPNCGDIDGRPSADDRDDAWAWYLENIIDV